MIKDKDQLIRLVTASKFLEKSRLPVEARKIKAIIKASSDKKSPFTLIVTKPEDRVQSSSEESLSAGLYTTEELEGFRESSIDELKETASNWDALSENDREYLANEVRLFETASHDLLAKMLDEEAQLDRMLSQLSKVPVSLPPPSTGEDKGLEEIFNRALKRAIPKIKEIADDIDPEIVGPFAQSNNDILYQIRAAADELFDILEKLSETEDLITILAALTTESARGRDDGVTYDFWNWTDLIEPLVKRFPLQAQWVVAKTENDQLRMELKECLQRVGEASE